MTSSKKTPLMLIRREWMRILTDGSLGAYATRRFAEHWFEFVFTQYNDPVRKYHTLVNQIHGGRGHIEFMLDEFKLVKHLAKNPDLVILAIILHDVIYKLGSKTNEADSAQFAKIMLLLMGAPKKVITIVMKLIMATRHLEKPLKSIDEQLIADIDLMGFGLSYDATLGASLRVREEYAHVSEEDFASGHGKIIHGFMGRGINLYRTPHFKENYGVKALENLRKILFDMRAIAHHKGKP